MNNKNSICRQLLLENSETKSSLKTENSENDYEIRKTLQDSLLDSISEGSEKNLIQKVPVLCCSPARHSNKTVELSRSL